jgi:hypothetical protein
MTSREFVYWLQGYFEVDEAAKDGLQTGLTHKQVSLIKKHLNMVFVHEIDPSYSDSDKLDTVHNPPPAPPKPPVKIPYVPSRPRC